MNNQFPKKIIGIKATANLGISPNGAEIFTIKFFGKILEEMGYEVHIIGANTLPTSLIDFQHYSLINYSFLPKFIMQLLHLPLAILNVLIFSIRKKPNFLFCTGGVFYNGLAINLVGKILNINFMIRSAEDHWLNYKFSKTWSSYLYNYLFTYKLSHLVLSHTKNILTVGIKSKIYFKSKFSNSDSKNIYGIPGILDSSLFYPEIDSSFKQELGIENDTKLILYVGAISGIKGSQLPELARLLENHSIKFHFLIIGNHTENLINTLDELKENFSNKITHINSISRNFLRRYYSNSDLLVFLCNTGIGYGQVTLEATQCNLPVLALDGGHDLSHWIGTGVCSNIKEMASRIVNSEYSVLDIPSYFDTNFLINEYRNMFNEVIKN